MFLLKVLLLNYDDLKQGQILPNTRSKQILTQNQPLNAIFRAFKVTQGQKLGESEISINLR